MLCRWFMLLVLFPQLLNGQTQNGSLTRPIPVSKLNGSIKIDGLSNEAGWAGMKPVSFFVLEPVYGAKASEKSELLITYDNRFLYVAARLYYNDSSKIVARNYVRDGWRGDDWFAFDIDARNDRQNAIRFALYPFGTHFDMAISNDAVELGNSTFNSNYNLVWEGRSALTKEGWFSEMKIPFAALRFRPRGTTTIMNISATRQSYHNNEKQHFPQVPQTVIDAARKPSLKQAFSFEGLSPRPLLYVTPSITSNVTRLHRWNALKNNYELQNETHIKPSLDLKFSLSSQVIADLTVNTDFSQAEADEQQFNLTRFSLFYPERRLFFQEQAGLFEFNLGSLSQLFYSRNIGLKEGSIIPIAGGARVTGTMGKTEFGIINIQTASDRITDSVYVGTENFGIVRTRNKVWNASSYIGTMFTSRVSKGQLNITGGADAVVKVKVQHYLLAALATSYDKENKSGTRANITWDLRKQDKFFYTLQYGYSGKNFNPGIGFVDRSDFHNLSASLSYGKFATEKKGWRYKKITATGNVYRNATNGKYETITSEIRLSGFTFKENYWALRLQYNYEYLQDTIWFGKHLSVPGGHYNFPQLIATYEAPDYLALRLPLTISVGRFYDGNRISVSTGPGWSINKYFELRTKYTLEYLSFAIRNLRSFIHIAALNLEWAFNLHWSGQWQAQYNSSIDKILANGRVRYHFSDGHDLYLVYNQTFNQGRYKQSPALPVFDQQRMLVKYYYTFHR